MQLVHPNACAHANTCARTRTHMLCTRTHTHAHLRFLPAAMGAPDLFHANMIAREMVMTMGMGRRMGPIELMKLVQNQQVRARLRSLACSKSHDPQQQVRLASCLEVQQTCPPAHVLAHPCRLQAAKEIQQVDMLHTHTYTNTMLSHACTCTHTCCCLRTGCVCVANRFLFSPNSSVLHLPVPCPLMSHCPVGAPATFRAPCREAACCCAQATQPHLRRTCTTVPQTCQPSRWACALSSRAALPCGTDCLHCLPELSPADLLPQCLGSPPPYSASARRKRHLILLAALAHVCARVCSSNCAQVQSSACPLACPCVVFV